MKEKNSKHFLNNFSEKYLNFLVRKESEGVERIYIMPLHFTWEPYSKASGQPMYYVLFSDPKLYNIAVAFTWEPYRTTSRQNMYYAQTKLTSYTTLK